MDNCLCRGLGNRLKQGFLGMGHNIVPSGAGWATFGWLTGVFVLGTIIFALSLQVIIARLRR
jgi:hypothetical protein